MEIILPELIVDFLLSTKAELTLVEGQIIKQIVLKIRISDPVHIWCKPTEEDFLNELAKELNQMIDFEEHNKAYKLHEKVLNWCLQKKYLVSNKKYTCALNYVPNLMRF